MIPARGVSLSPEWKFGCYSLERQVVSVASTIADPSKITSVNRRQKDGRMCLLSFVCGTVQYVHGGC